jgi:hypothetical protein
MRNPVTEKAKKERKRECKKFGINVSGGWRAEFLHNIQRMGFPVFLFFT